MNNSRLWIKNEGLSRIILSLLLGQLVAFFVALMGFTASITADLGVNTPISLSFFSYMAQALVYGGILIYRRQNLLVSWYWYLLLALINVQANYLVNKAYEYTSITSVALLNCWTIAWSILLTWIFLGTRYSLSQFLGAAICVTGVGVVVLSDAGGGGTGGSRPLLGDALIIGGTFFFALSNVGEEFCVKRKDQVEVVAMIGLFGMLVSVFEVAAFEREELKSAKWSTEAILAFAGYAIACFLCYTFVPVVLKISGSTLLNLSLLTTNMWSVAIRIFFYKQKVNWLYYPSLALVVVGLVIFSRSEKDTVVAKTEDGDQDLQSRLLIDEESTAFLK